METIKTQEQCWRQLNAELKKITRENRNFDAYSLFRQPNQNANDHGNGIFTSFLRCWPDAFNNRPENFVAARSSESSSGNNDNNHFSLFSQQNENRNYHKHGIWSTHSDEPSSPIELKKENQTNSHFFKPLFESAAGTSWPLDFDAKSENWTYGIPSELPLKDKNIVAAAKPKDFWEKFDLESHAENAVQKGDKNFAVTAKPKDFWERFDLESYVETTGQKDEDPNSFHKFTGKKNNAHCAFCQKNQEPVKFYRSHNLKDKNGRVTCPILKTYICPRCGATGKNAHTVKYCKMKDIE